MSESGGEGLESRSDGDGPGPGEEGPLLSGGEQGGGTEGCDRAEPRAWLRLGKSPAFGQILFSKLAGGGLRGRKQARI